MWYKTLQHDFDMYYLFILYYAEPQDFCDNEESIELDWLLPKSFDTKVKHPPQPGSLAFTISPLTTILCLYLYLLSFYSFS